MGITLRHTITRSYNWFIDLETQTRFQAGLSALNTPLNVASVGLKTMLI